MSPALMVDDDPAILELFSAVLRIGGYEARTTPNASRVYQLSGDQTPLMLITDVRMPCQTDGAMLAEVQRSVGLTC